MWQSHVCLFTQPLFTFARLYRFSLINFTFWCLTLFSKFYFNFPSQYLFAIGLTIIFSVRCTFTTCHTFHTTIPSWTTLKKQAKLQWAVCRCTRLSLSMVLLSNKLYLQSTSSLVCVSHKLQFADTLLHLRFQFCALYPFHSPLLWISLLISFPPVNDMLKFTGWFGMKRWKIMNGFCFSFFENRNKIVLSNKNKNDVFKR